MAEKTVIDIQIESAQAASSIAELRKSLKALINEQANVAAGSSEWKKLTKAINDTEGKIGDLTDSFSTLKGSGIERTNASLGLLREGFTNLDPGKIKLGFQGIGAAMSALPIFLIVEGLKVLIDNFSEVVKFGKELFDIFSAEERAVRKVNAELEKQKDVTSKLTKELTREIELMEAQGKSHTSILAKKKELIETQIQEAVITAKLAQAKIKEVQANDSIYESTLRLTASLARKIGQDEYAERLENMIAENKAERNKENVKQLQESFELIKDLQNKELVETAKVNKEIADNNKKSKEDLFNYNKDRKKLEAESEAAAEQYLAEQNKLAEENKRKYAEQTAQAKADLFMQTVEAGQKAYDQDEKNFEESEKAKQEAAGKALEAGRAISEAVFAWQLRAAEGNAKKEMEIRKRMFQVDKAFNVARAIQDGIRSVQAALTIPPPGGNILAGFNAAIAAANVAKILATKFEPGNTGGGSSQIEAPSSQTPNIPQVQTQAQSTQPSTQFDSTGRNLNIVAKVYEGEMTSAQKRTQMLEEQSTI